MATPSSPCIYEHDAASILPHLAVHLPHSISLLRRIQHGLAYPSSTAKILATFPPGATPDAPGSADPDSRTPWLAARVDLFRGRETQILAYSSLEFECTSIQPIVPVTPSEAAGAPSTSDTTVSGPATIPRGNNDGSNYVMSAFTASPAALDLVRAQLLAFLRHVKAALLPVYLSSLPKAPPVPAESGSASSAGSSSTPTGTKGVPLIPAPPPQAFLFGSMHTALFTLLLRSGNYGHASASVDSAACADADILLPGLRAHRFDSPPYHKYVFPRSVFAAGGAETEVPLPTGYRYQDRRGRIGVLPSQLDLVQSRTHIPRSRAQLSTMPGVAIYCDSPAAEAEAEADSAGQTTHGEEEEDEMPIAWAFLGLDGSLATLHVEPEHRGQGLAIALSRETMRRGMNPNGVFGAGGEYIKDEKLRSRIGEMVHTEVGQHNKASQRVMEKIGGEVFSSVMWTVIELCEESSEIHGYTTDL
ncbi:Acyl-CoA N-acyltransferase [Penicillium hispanicum]|uniref:Acyl-CoA N-acyltransferase n=1 Tax=Penicillium hispanicum TaxID=1080232 RepID=UPI00254181A3|nr:Acyl-CoA N-acyltransferase [Penicillium hispanicum]KAJ5594421.1 Acyl-CoA N-acyltransferase [Penicillium hispanicum]